MPITSGGSARRRKMEPAKMVGWFDLGQLFKTGGDVAISTILGRQADRRLLEQFVSQKMPVYDHSKTGRDTPLESLTLDYISDTGDGFNSTYAVFYWATRPKLEFGEVETERGSVLILGGDEVYPVGDRDEYERRLLKPMEAAMGETRPPHPNIYAVPGNHDWYDSLISFTRLFISRLWIAGWSSQQDRSYFALKLPHGWWVVATDVGLESDIDDPQLKFLEHVAKTIPANDRVILCNAEPFWIKAADYQRDDINLQLIENLLGDRIRVFLAGDLHHYRRHESPDGRHKITAGGGGAFLHPTHQWSKVPLPGGFKLVEKATFPPEAESRKLTIRNIPFFVKNRSFGAATAILYMLTAWSVMANISTYDMSLTNLRPVAFEVIKTGLQNSVAAFWVVLIVLGFFFFTETTSKAYRYFGGLAHALAHLTACFILGWAGERIAFQANTTFGDPLFQIVSGAVLLAGGYVFGSVLMGTYLCISLNVFGRHRNEAFSALKIEDWKHFLRLRVDAHGALTIFPIGIKRVPRQWEPANPNDPLQPQFVPAGDGNGDAFRPALIEAPIIVFK